MLDEIIIMLGIFDLEPIVLRYSMAFIVFIFGLLVVYRILVAFIYFLTGRK